MYWGHIGIMDKNIETTIVDFLMLALCGDPVFIGMTLKSISPEVYNNLTPSASET